MFHISHFYRNYRKTIVIPDKGEIEVRNLKTQNKPINHVFSNKMMVLYLERCTSRCTVATVANVEAEA